MPSFFKRKSYIPKLLAIITLIIFFFLVFLTRNLIDLIADYKAQQVVRSCENLKNWSDCYALAIFPYTNKYGKILYSPIFEKIQRIDNKTNDCHFIAHKISGMILKNNPQEISDLFRFISLDACGGGYIHGIIEGKKGYDPQFKFDSQSTEAICKQITNNRQTAQYFCFHSIGHVLLVEKNAQIDQALKACQDSFSESHYHCLTGVFMESITGYNLEVHGYPKPPLWTPDNIRKQIEICNKYTGETQVACWEEISHMFISNSEASISKTYKNCNGAPNYPSRKSCIIHASQLFILNPEAKMEEVSSLCKPLYNDDYESCIKDTVDAALLVTNNYRARVQVLCDSLDNQIKNICLDQAKKYEPLFHFFGLINIK